MMLMMMMTMMLVMMMMMNDDGGGNDDDGVRQPNRTGLVDHGYFIVADDGDDNDNLFSCFFSLSGCPLAPKLAASGTDPSKYG